MDFSGLRPSWERLRRSLYTRAPVICFGGLIFAMSGRFQDAIPSLLGALFGAGRSDRVQAGLARLPVNRCEATKRGEPLPINQALNRPRAKLGLDLSAWMTILFVTLTVCHLQFPNDGGRHPKMLQLWGLSLSQTSYYDPRKH